MKKLTMAIIAAMLLLFATGCGGDAGSKGTETKLVGSWKQADGNTLVLNADRTLSLTYKTGSWGIITPTTIVVSGTWHIAGDDLIVKWTSSTHMKNELVGMVESEKIVEVAAYSFTTIDSEGTREVYKRIR